MYGKTLLQIGFEHVLGLNMYGKTLLGFSVCLLRMMGGNKKWSKLIIRVGTLKLIFCLFSVYLACVWQTSLDFWGYFKMGLKSDVCICAIVCGSM